MAETSFDAVAGSLNSKMVYKGYGTITTDDWKNAKMFIGNIWKGGSWSISAILFPDRYNSIIISSAAITEVKVYWDKTNGTITCSQFDTNWYLEGLLIF